MRKPAPRHQRRGAAMMIVMVLLMLLVAMAVPFLFTMSQQEGTSAGSMAGEDARIAARTGADFAYARLHRANRLVERERWYAKKPEDLGADPLNPLFDSPYSDSNVECLVDPVMDLRAGLYPRLMDGNNNPRLNLEDWRSLVAGVNVQDESGKVDLNTATPLMIGSLLGAGIVTACDPPQGQTFPSVTLDNAEFLGERERIGGKPGTEYGGGYVVISDILFSYEKRVGNRLIEVTANAAYPSGTALFGAAPVKFTEALIFMQRAFSPLAYKIAYWRAFKSRDGRTPYSFNNLGEVRDIARESWFTVRRDFNDANGFWEGLDPITYQEFADLATVVAPTARFDGRFFYPQLLYYHPPTSQGGAGGLVQQQTNKAIQGVWLDTLNALPPEIYHSQDPRNPAVQRAGIGRGNMVRVSQAGGQSRLMHCIIHGLSQPMPPPYLPPSHHMVANGTVDFLLREPALVEVAERNPVNINTAPYAVLKAVVLGLGGVFRMTSDGPKVEEPTITNATAAEFAARVIARTRFNIERPEDYNPFDDAAEFDEFISELVETGLISPSSAAAIRGQQAFPYFFSYSTPFSFQSLDAYSVDSMAIRYAPTGGELAREGFREQVLLGSDDVRTVRWRLLHEDFGPEMATPQGNIFQRYLGGSENGRLRGVIEAPMLHWPLDEKFRRTRWENIAEPFGRGSARRLDVANLAGYKPPQPGTPPGVGTGDVFFDYVYMDNQNNQRGDLTAGHLAFWFKPRGELGLNTRVIFDTAESNTSNRMSLLWWGGRRRGHRLSQHNSGLVFRIKDRTLEDAYAECRFELDPDMFRPGHWYHIALNWKGTKLSEASMVIDGDGVSGTPGGVRVRAVMDHTFHRNRSDWVSPARYDDWVARTSTLLDDICGPHPAPPAPPHPPGTPGLDDIRIEARDVNAFEPIGVLQIGDEVIEYQGHDTFNRLLNVRRGARGTVWQPHPQGSKVTIFGYTTQVQSLNHNNRDYPAFPHLPVTTASLQTDMGTLATYRVTQQGAKPFPDHFVAPVFGPDAGFTGADGQWTQNTERKLPLASTAGLQSRGVVAVVGVAWRGYQRGYPTLQTWYPDFEPAAPGVPDYGANTNNQMRWTQALLKMEFVYYDGIDPDGLRVVERYDENFVLKDPADWLHFAPSYNAAQMYADPNNPMQLAMSEFFARGTMVIPVSIECTNINNYHNHSYVALDDEWFFYNLKFDKAPLLVYTNGNNVFAWARQQAITAGNPNNPVSDSQLLPCPSFRRILGTTVGVHTAGTPVIPCFLSTSTSGRGDLITLVDSKNANKEQHRIRNQRVLQLPNITTQPTVPGGTYHVCSLDDHVRYPRIAGAAICKFPTGELPVELPTNWSFAGPDPRTTDSGAATEQFLDSFEIKRYQRGNFRLMQPLTDAQPWANDIQVNGISGLARGVGMVRIDDELIAYRGTAMIPIQRQVMQGNPPQLVTITIQTYWLLDVERGALGTVAAPHAQGSSIMNLASIRMGRPDETGFATWGDQEPLPPMRTVTTMRDNRLHLVQGDAPMRPYGFMRLEQGYYRVGARKLDEPQVELVGYQRLEPRPNSTNARADNLGCTTPVAGLFNMQGYPALFRGAFGTRPREFTNYALYYELPTRFPDWFAGVAEDHRKIIPIQPDSPLLSIPGAQSPEINYFQGAVTLRNTDWGEMRWQISFVPHASEFLHTDSIAAKLVVRYDGKGEWGSTPTNRPGGLYVYDFDINGLNTRQLEMGVYEQRDHPARGANPAAGTSQLTPVRADRIEWRIYYYFLPGAFDRDDWKITLQLHEFSVDVTQHTRVLRHEEHR